MNPKWIGGNPASLYDMLDNKEDLYKTALENCSQHSLSDMKEIIDQPGSALMNLVIFFKLWKVAIRSSVSVVAFFIIPLLNWGFVRRIFQK